ncbi:hypothetical protein N9B82_03085 [Saprospiraceae bacterium]|nr:hypothetical protein [Saprospiraceae bacterium]
MDKSSIEQKIKDRLQNHGEQIDNEALFSALGIEEKPSKKRFIWIPFVLVVLTLSGVYFFGNYNNNTIAEIENTDRHSNQKRTSQHIKDRASKNKTASSGLKVKEASSEVIEEITNTNAATNSEPAITNSELAKTASQKVNSTATSKAKNSAVSEMGSKNITPVALYTLNENQDVSSENGGINESTSENRNLTNSIASVSSPTRADFAITNTTDVTGTEVQKERESLADFYVEQNLEYLKVDRASLAINGSANSNEDEIYEFSEEDAGSKWYIMPFVSYDQYNNNLKSKSDKPIEGESFLRGNELEHISAGLLGTYMFNEHWYGSFGLEYSQYSSKFNHSEYFSSIQSDTGTISRIDYLGEITQIPGTEVLETETERKWTIYNKLSMIQIPVTVGYNLDHERYSLFTELGMNVGIYSQFSGALFDEHYAIVRDPSFYKMRPNLSMEIGLGAVYHLSSKSGLFGKIRFRQSLASISNISNPLDETLSQAGLVLGYRYKL